MFTGFSHFRFALILGVFDTVAQPSFTIYPRNILVAQMRNCVASLVSCTALSLTYITSYQRGKVKKKWDNIYIEAEISKVLGVK